MTILPALCQKIQTELFTDMSRIIAVGCSFTYGHCLHTEDVRPVAASPQAWPGLVAQHFNRECVNLSWPGSNPRYCAARILDFDFKSDDVVLILWPNIHRNWIVTDWHAWRERNWRDEFHREPDLAVGSQFWTPVCKDYQRWWKRGYSNTSDRACDAWMAKHLVRLHLKDLGLDCVEYDVPAYDLDKNISIPDRFVTDWITEFPHWHQLYVDRAQDGMHPGFKAHKNFAKRWIKTIKQQGILE